MKRIRSFTGLAALFCSLAITTHATFLPPGAFGVPPGGAATFPGGAADLVSAFSTPVPGGTLAGTLSTWFSTDAANPFGPGALSFYYQILNTGSSIVEGFTAAGFAGFLVDVTTIVAGPPANGAALTTSRSFFDGGNIVGFQFPGAAAIPPGGILSDIMVVHTSFTGTPVLSTGGIIDGGATSAAILAPVPEPTTMIAGALLLLPFALSTIRRLRKSRMA